MNKHAPLSAYFEAGDESRENADGEKPGAYSRPLVILHGLMGSKSNWRSLQKAIGALGKASWALDLRNHGASFHDDDNSYPAMAADLAGWLSDNQIDEYDLMGHSMGGKVVMDYLLAGAAGKKNMAPRPHKTIIVDIAPLAYGGGQHSPLFTYLLGLDLSKFDSRKAVQTHLAEKFGAGMAAFISQNLVLDEAGKPYKWRINLQGLTDNLPLIEGFPDHQMPAEDGDILFIRGEMSDYINDQGKQAAAKLFPTHKLVTVKGASHWPHMDKADEFTKILAAYLGL